MGKFLRSAFSSVVGVVVGLVGTVSVADAADALRNPKGLLPYIAIVLGGILTATGKSILPAKPESGDES